MRIKLVLGTMMILAAGRAFSSGGFEGINETGVRTLRVEGAVVSVEVTGSLGRTVVGRAYDIPNNIEIKYDRFGDTVRVWIDKRFSLLGGGGDPVLRFEVPRATDLDISTASGNISIKGMLGDYLHAASSSGSIEIDDVRTSVHAQTSSGDLYVADIDGDTHAETASGEIELRQILGEVVGSTSSGGIEAHDLRGDVSLTTASGDIELDDITGTMRASSSSGSISGRRVQINGDSTFTSRSGTIRIDFNNPLNSLSFRLTSTTGSLRVGDVTGNKSLTAGSGRFLVKGETSSGNQRYE